MKLLIQAREGMAFPRAVPLGHPSGKENPGSPSLLLEVYTRLKLVVIWQLKENQRWLKKIQNGPRWLTYIYYA